MRRKEVGAGMQLEEDMSLTSPRLRTAFLLSVADVFFGAAGILLILIVMSATVSQERIVEAFDMTAKCRGVDRSSFRIWTEGEKTPMTEEDWLATVPEGVFMVRLGLSPEGRDASCYHLAIQAAQRHNQRLESRGATQAVLSIGFNVSDGDAR